jgi:hypothetical protein
MILPVEPSWFRAEDAGNGIARFVEPYIDTMLGSNVWHVRGASRDLVIRGCEPTAFLAASCR